MITLFTAATAAHQNAAIPLTPVALLLLIGYAISSLLWPWKNCILCNNRKKFYPWHSGRIFRMCPRCHGRGKEFRIGTRIWRGVFGHGFSRHE